MTEFVNLHSHIYDWLEDELIAALQKDKYDNFRTVKDVINRFRYPAKPKVGDTVMIYRRVLKEEGWENSWTSGMDEWVGHIGEVVAVESCGVRLRNATYSWPPSALWVINDPVESHPTNYRSNSLEI